MIDREEKGILAWFAVRLPWSLVKQGEILMLNMPVHYLHAGQLVVEMSNSGTVISGRTINVAKC